MRLRQKTALIVGGTLAGLIVVLSLVFELLVLGRFRSLQEQDALESATRAVDALSGEALRLASMTQDYATWDDLYSFMETRDERFLKTGLLLPTAEQVAVRIDLLALVDSSGNVVYAKAVDQRAGTSNLLPQGSESLLKDPRLLAAAVPKGIAGVSLETDWPVLLAAKPILRTNGRGPPRGALIMARTLDSVQLEVLTRYANATVTAYRVDGSNLPEDVSRARSALSHEARLVTLPRGADRITGFARVDDIFGRRALVLKAESPRMILREGRASLAYLIAALLAVGLIFGIVTLYLIQTLMLSRLGRLSDAVDGIAAHANFSGRVPTSGHDELARLGVDVNNMLDALETSQRSLEENREKLRDVVENSSDLFYSHNRDLQITYASPQTRAFLDCEPEDALKNWAVFLSDHPANARGTVVMRRAIETGERQPLHELELLTTKGRRVWVEANEAPVVRNGRTVAVVGALNNVTARKEAETERIALEDRLRQAQKMEAVGQLAGGIAHDFNNLLGVILGHCELLGRAIGESHPGQQRVEHIRQAGQRAAGLTSRLLAFSRKQVLTPEIVDLNRIASGLQGKLGRLVGEQVQLATRLEEGLRPVRVDPGQFEQVIVNLALNARDAMPVGGRLTIETAHAELDEQEARRHREARAGFHVMLAVGDTGEGMDAETLSHVFEPFFTTREVGKGSGLGLAMVYGVVKQSQGFITVESQSGVGTTVRIFLPPAEQGLLAGHDDAQRAPAGEPLSGSVTVLLVEDDSSLRSMICEFLVEGGYEVLGCAGPDEALATARSHRGPIHLLLTDVIMPQMTGPEVAKRLLGVLPRLRVLYMSGYTADALGHRGGLEVGTQLISKPFTPDALLRRVREVLDRR